MADDAKKHLDDLLGRTTLYNRGKDTKIEQFIRPQLPLPQTKRKNVIALLKDDVKREDPIRTIARAMRAIIAAVYYDGGLDAARRVMHNMSMTLAAT